jgi:hypothetical protein
MNWRLLSFLFILISAVVAMGAPSDAASPDWVDRMSAALSHAPESVTAGTASPLHETEDWIDRLIAARSRELTPRSVLEVETVKTALITACGVQNIDGMLALFDRNARLVSGGRTYVGTDQIREYWVRSGAFRPGSRWVGYSSGHTVRVGPDADSATLVFECVWLDAGTSRIVARSFARDVLVRSGGAWTIKEMSSEVTSGI